MAKKIIGGIGGLIGIGKKKKAADPAASATEQKGPIVTPLGDMTSAMRRRRSVAGATSPGLALGVASKLGG